MYLARRHQAQLEQPLQGWFGHARPFAFDPYFEPAPDMRRLLCGTPPIVSMAALEASLELWQQVDMQQVRHKSTELGDLFWQLVQTRCDGLGLELASPRNPAERGSHLSLAHEDGYPVMQALIARGIIGDFRAPNLLRFGFAPLYIRFQDIWHAVEVLEEVLRSGEYRQQRFQLRDDVT